MLAEVAIVAIAERLNGSCYWYSEVKNRIQPRLETANAFDKVTSWQEGDAILFIKDFENGTR